MDVATAHKRDIMIDSSQKRATDKFNVLSYGENMPENPSKENIPKKVISPEQKEHLLELRERVEKALETFKKGDIEGTKDLLQDASKFTKCGTCSQILDRTRVDLDYINNLCLMDEKDCEPGKDSIFSKFDFILNEYLPSVE